MITYGSICSGIEAATVAWHPLGWKPLWFAQFDPEHDYERGPDFPSAVLDHHYPDVPNCGSMLLYPSLVREGILPAPDVLVGGTPCQGWSTAGARKGLADERGQLMLHFIELANAVDEVRIARDQEPCIILWENVPGVLNSHDNGFGHLLAGLAGDDEPLEPGPRPDDGKSAYFWRWKKDTGVHAPKWPHAGAAVGPKRAVSWRVLDAQYADLAQRRERVFVVASARKGFDPGAVLLECEGVRRDSPPQRPSREDVAGTLAGGARKRGGYSTDDIPLVRTINDRDVSPTIDANVDKKWGSDQWVNGGMGVIDEAFGQNRQSGPVDVSHALSAHAGPHGRLDFESETFLVRDVFTGDGETADPISASEHKTYTHEGKTGVRMHNVVEHPAATLCAGDGGISGKDCPEGRVVPDHHRVRRLMPIECERLQGFPDGYTAIPWKGKALEDCPDGPRYKALGNSMAVTIMRWIGERIERELGT